MSGNFVIFDKIIGNPFGLTKELSKVTQSVPKLAGVFVNSATNIIKEVRKAWSVGKSFVSFVSKSLAHVQLENGFQIHCKVLVITKDRKFEYHWR